MSRNSSGTYSLPVAAYVAGTTIKSTDMNTNLSDIATALTQSVATTGVSSMSGPMKLALGSLVAPGIVFSNDLTTGWYNSAAGTWTYATSGTGIFALGPTGGVITNLTVNNLTVTGSFSVSANRIVGEVVDYCGASVPALWLFAFGQAISRTTYSSLFAAIGTAYGAGDGSTTFNVPDYRGRVGVGRDDMGGVAANRITAAISGITGTTLGATGGEEGHSLALGELASHTHTGSGTTGGESATHTHNVTIQQLAIFGGGGAGGMQASGTTVTAANNTDHTHSFSFTTAGTGSGTAHNNVQPSVIVNKMIYTAV